MVITGLPPTALFSLAETVPTVASMVVLCAVIAGVLILNCPVAGGRLK